MIKLTELLLWRSNNMSGYRLSWITESIAVGSAPMSFADLDDIKSTGIDAIVNLCAEFSDLHELEETSGFEVYYLPVWDEDVPVIIAELLPFNTGIAKTFIHCLKWRTNYIINMNFF